MQVRVDWVLIIFGTQVINKKRPVRPVFTDYLSVFYDYGSNQVIFWIMGSLAISTKFREKKIKRGIYPNCWKSETSKCHTDIFSYLRTYLRNFLTNWQVYINCCLKKLYIDDCRIYLFFTDWLCGLALRLKDQNLNPLWTDLICSKFWLPHQLHFFRDVLFVRRILYLHFHHCRL